VIPSDSGAEVNMMVTKSRESAGSMKSVGQQLQQRELDEARRVLSGCAAAVAGAS
jgi:hypothetical protein